MAASFPGELSALPTTENNEVKSKDTHPALHNNANAEINAIEATLGKNPQSVAASVAARLGTTKALGEVEGVTALNCALGTLFTAKLKGAAEFEPTNAPAGVPYQIQLQIETVTFAFSIKGVTWIGGAEPTFEANKKYLITLICINGEILGVGPQGPAGPAGIPGSAYLAWRDEQNLKGWTYNPVSGSKAIMTTERIYFAKLMVTPGETLAKAFVNIVTKGETLSAGKCFLGIYSQVGKLLGKTADQSGVWTTVGLKEAALVATEAGSLTIPANVKWVFAAFLCCGTTMPEFSIQSSLAETAVVNVNLTAATGLRAGIFNTAAQTALPAEIAIENFTAQPQVRWMGVV